MNEPDFQKLENLNARLDVCIDEEDFGQFNAKLKISRKVKKQDLDRCFPQGERKYATHDDEWEKSWKIILTGNVTEAEDIPLTRKQKEEKDLVKELWSYLFYAKWLRSNIQQKSYSDCYIRRLDDVLAYLERHLPNHRVTEGREEKGQNIRLAIVFLLELAATSFGPESIGYAERARRLIKEAKSLKLAQGPFEFYELWARYNIGVAYFHTREYRKAVLAFNIIIWQVMNWDIKKDQDREKVDYFDVLSVERLLLIPSKLYRAEVQLKLQLAFHSHKTLEDIKLIHEKESEHVEEARFRKYRSIRINIINAQAYQQLGRLDKSRESLSEIYATLLPGKQLTFDKRLDLIGGTKLPFTKDDIKKFAFPKLGERFLDILIEDFLNWLKGEGIDKTEPPPITQDLKLSELERLSELFQIYYHSVEKNLESRRGYYQQLATFLDVLVKTGTENSLGIANSIYTIYRDGLLEEEPGLSSAEGDVESDRCTYCSRTGIDLRRIDDEHHEWFTKAMLEFFNTFKNIEDKDRFVKRLLRLERREKDDLRVNDLEYRYKKWEPQKLLDIINKKPKSLCWSNLDKKQINNFELLECAGVNLDANKDVHGNLLPHYLYQSIMDGWHEQFLRHIDKNSFHGHHSRDSKGFYFLGLQRWNSSSPAKGFSVGGGYLLYHLNSGGAVDLGIAIDPGFDFVRNLFHNGYSLDDIDIVLISHAHLDHIRDFESIVTLLFELKKRSSRARRVHVILSLGAYKRLEHIVEDAHLRYFVEPYIVDIDREIVDEYFEHLGEEGSVSFRFQSSLKEKKRDNARAYFDERFQVILDDMDEKTESNLEVTIKPTRAYHSDQTHSDSFGFIIRLMERKGERGSPLVFGYTGDTK